MPRYNKIFAGPVTQNTPQVQELPAANGNILPGCLIVANAGTFALAGAGAQGKLFIAQDNYLTMKGVDDAYAADDTVIGMELLDEQFFNARVATGNNLVKGSELTSTATGRLALAVAGDFVVAHSEETFNNNTGADQLVRVRPAKGYVAA